MSGSGDYTLTPALGLYKPNYNLDVDEWGTHLNDNADILDQAVGALIAGGPYLPLAGGALTGPLALHGDATAALQPTTLQQVNAAISGASYLPLAGGTLTGGIHFGTATAPGGTSDLSRHIDLYAGTFGFSITPARFNIVAAAGSNISLTVGAQDSIYVSDTQIRLRVPAVAQAPAAADNSNTIATTAWVRGLALPLAGGTMTGPLLLAADPIALLEAATKQYVDARIYGDAPSDANAYGRLNAAWSRVLPLAGGTMTGPLTLDADPAAALQSATKQHVDAANAATASVAAHNSGRNLINNALMNIAQRGAGNFTVSGYTLDQWCMVGATPDAPIIYNGGLLDSHRAQIGDEAARKALQFSVSGTATGYSFVYQPMESIARLAGKTIIISFWAVQLGAGTPKIGVGWSQYFGSGGSPSAQVSGNAGGATLSSVMQRFQFTAALPSIAGKTLGTNGNDATFLELWFSDGANAFAVRNGGIGQQSANAMIWGVQVEIAQPGQTQASPLEKLRPSDDLARCQWFFRYVANNIIYWMPTGPSQAQVITFSYGGFMRARPSLTFYPTYTNCNGMSINGTNSIDHINVQVISVAAGAAYAFFDMALTAEL